MLRLPHLNNFISLQYNSLSLQELYIYATCLYNILIVYTLQFTVILKTRFVIQQWLEKIVNTQIFYVLSIKRKRGILYTLQFKFSSKFHFFRASEITYLFSQITLNLWILILADEGFAVWCCWWDEVELRRMMVNIIN